MSESYCYEQARRLRSKSDFDKVFRTGIRGGDQYFTVIVNARTSGHARLGLAVSKREARLAVERNRLKRLVRESFRRSVARELALDIVVIAKRAATSAPNHTLARALDRRWDSLRKFCSRAPDASGSAMA